MKEKSFVQKITEQQIKNLGLAIERVSKRKATAKKNINQAYIVETLTRTGGKEKEYFLSPDLDQMIKWGEVDVESHRRACGGHMVAYVRIATITGEEVFYDDIWG